MLECSKRNSTYNGSEVRHSMIRSWNRKEVHGWSVEVKKETARVVTKSNRQVMEGLGSHTKMFRLSRRHEETFKSC